MIPPEVHKIRVPLAGSPLGWVNSYVIRADDGYALVDCGWDTPDALAALRRGLDDLGIRLEDVRTLIVTHNHPDHYGLAGRLVQLASCGVVMHRLDAVHIESRYSDYAGLEEEMGRWLRVHGVPREDVSALVKASEAILERVNVAVPEREVDGGERIAAGSMEWEIVWTPGHSAGHICLYERNRRLFMSGDHILNPITPNIGLHVQSMGNPLADYISSLRNIRDYDVDVVLPAHGDEFRGYRERIDALLSHHGERLREIKDILSRGPQTSYQVGSRMTWNVDLPWEQQPPFVRRMATTEAIAHLELLHSRGDVRQVIGEGGLILYELSKTDEGGRE